MFSPAQHSAIEDLISESVRSALSTFQTLSITHFLSSANQSCCTPGMAYPLGLSRPLDKSLEHKILRGDQGDPKLCAPISTSLLVADAVTAATRTYATTAIAPTTPPQTAPCNSSTTPASPQNPVSMGKNTVEQLQCNQRPLASSPIDIFTYNLNKQINPIATLTLIYLVRLRRALALVIQGRVHSGFPVTKFPQHRTLT